MDAAAGLRASRGFIEQAVDLVESRRCVPPSRASAAAHARYGASCVSPASLVSPCPCQVTPFRGVTGFQPRTRATSSAIVDSCGLMSSRGIFTSMTVNLLERWARRIALSNSPLVEAMADSPPPTSSQIL